MIRRRENYLKALLSLFSMVLMIYIGSTLFKRVQLDFTDENLYTLSAGTQSILSKLDSPVRLKLYYSKTAANKGAEGLRSFNNYFVYIRELLRQYVAHSRNNLTLEVIDPRPDTVEEEDAIVYGLKKFNLTDSEKYFFGLVAENESGTEKIIEFFDPNQKDKLEYELTKLIYLVLKPQKKKVGVISSLDMIGNDENAYFTQIMRMQGKEIKETWAVIKMLREFYQVEKVELTVESITGFDLLVVVHPRILEDKTLFAIDQYLMRGGNILVFLDPYAVSDRMASLMGASAQSSSPGPGFSKLMEKWGVSVKAGYYAGDRSLSGMGRMSPNLPPSRLLALLNCDKRCTELHKDPITSGINNTTFILPGVLETKATEGIVHSTIMSTTAKGNSYTARGQEVNNPQAIWNKFQDGDKPVVLAYKALGKFKTAFPQGVEDKDKKKKSKNNDDKKTIIRESEKESAIIIFSDVDFINNQFAFKRSFLGLAVANANSTLFINSVEALTGDVDLMSVRSKGKIDRSFDVINEIELAAEKKTSKKTQEINANIVRFQNELNQLGLKANEGNIALLRNEGLKKKKELAKKIAILKKELRAVKREGREKIESIGVFFQLLNTLLVPLIVIIIGVYYNRKRSLLTQGRAQGAEGGG